MKIKYRANGSVREVRDSIGKALIANGIAQPVYQTRQTRQMVAEAPKAKPEIAVTVKPKRKYTRRDMTASEE